MIKGFYICIKISRSNAWVFRVNINPTAKTKSLHSRKLLLVIYKVYHDQIFISLDISYYHTAIHLQ